MYQTKKNYMLFNTLLVAVFALAVAPASAGSKKSVWVKAQGKLNKNGTLVVEEIKQRKPSKRLVLEGIISRTHEDNRTFVLAGQNVVLQTDCKITYISGKPATIGEIQKNVRVKARGTFSDKHFKAAKIRIFQFSDDDDVEVEGPVTFNKSLKNGDRVLRVGPISLLLQSNRAGGSTQPSWLSQLFDFKGKAKVADNSRAVEEAETDFSTGSKRYGKLQTTFGMTFSKRIQGYSRLEFYWRDQTQSDPMNATQQFDFRLRDLYISFQDLAGMAGLQFRIGRQRFRDRRTWLMDSRLDAVQLMYQRPGAILSVAVSRRLGSRTTNSDQLHYIGKLYYKFANSLRTTFYVIKQVDERPHRDNPLWVALQTRGRFGRFGEYWAQGARYSSHLAGTRRIGYAYDAGMVLRPFTRKNGPFASYHIAYGSADDQLTTTVRERFRQPRLQLNYYLYGASKRLYYYGGLLTPELSNLRFQAFSLGYKVSSSLSVQGIWRMYRQINPSTTIRSNSLGIAPEGINKQLGDDAEILLNIRPMKPLEVSVSAEWFFSGDAFAVGTGKFFGLRSDVTFYF